ncbi:MAG: GTP-binding protein, partial [Clostridia bacterium]|nr:GTP-binding protein [Clostridia bacterium]
EDEHEHHHHHHDHDDDDDDDECCCHHHHDDDDDDDEHEHEHHHHHDHDEDEHEHHHHHHHHQGHDADEIFTSWGVNTAKKFTTGQIETILTGLDSGEYGQILRSKGIVSAADGTWIYFDYVPEEHDIRTGSPDINGKLCVIGAELKEDKLKTLFGV